MPVTSLCTPARIYVCLRYLRHTATEVSCALGSASLRWGRAALGAQTDSARLNTETNRSKRLSHNRASSSAASSDDLAVNTHAANMANAYLQGVEISASQFLDIFHHYDNDGNFFHVVLEFLKSGDDSEKTEVNL